MSSGTWRLLRIIWDWSSILENNWRGVTACVLTNISPSNNFQMIPLAERYDKTCQAFFGRYEGERVKLRINPQTIPFTLDIWSSHFSTVLSTGWFPSKPSTSWDHSCCFHFIASVSTNQPSESSLLIWYAGYFFEVTKRMFLSIRAHSAQMVRQMRALLKFRHYLRSI